MRAKLLLVLSLFLFAAPGAWAATLRVAAAADLEQVFHNGIIPAFEKQTGVTIVPVYGATKLLALQLTNGAPFDVLVSADTATVTQLAREGLVEAKTERVYAIGRLVMWTRRDAKHHPKRIQDLANPVYAKIAIANPEVAPYGIAAKQSLASAGLTRIVASRLVIGENIQQALQYAQSGNADVSLTALSLVIGDKTDPWVIVPDRLHAPIAQATAVVTASSQQAVAQQFEDFLTGRAAARIWKSYKYDLPK